MAHCKSLEDILQPNNSAINWNTIAACGGPEKVLERVEKNGLWASIWLDTPHLGYDHCALSEPLWTPQHLVCRREGGRIFATRDLTWKSDRVIEARLALLMLESPWGQVVARCAFGGLAFAVAGDELCVRWSSKGLFSIEAEDGGWVYEQRTRFSPEECIEELKSIIAE